MAPRKTASPGVSLIQMTDLRGITRDSELCEVLVSVETGYDSKTDWVLAGAANLHKAGEQNGIWLLDARMGRGATDFEEDSAYAFSLSLIGVHFDSVRNHFTTFRAWVDPNAGDPFPAFHVPRPGYNPLKDPSTVKCTTRGCIPKGHPIVAHFTPPFDPELYEAVRGKKVSITFGPVYEKR